MTPHHSQSHHVQPAVLTPYDTDRRHPVLARGPEAPDSQEGAGCTEGPLEGRSRPLADVIPRSDQMRAVREKALQYAAVDSPVLLLGETGTGKGVFARLIHQASRRAGGPFIEVNCG